MKLCRGMCNATDTDNVQISFCPEQLKINIKMAEIIVSLFNDKQTQQVLKSIKMKITVHKIEQ